jgi:hypothetical protein
VDAVAGAEIFDVTQVVALVEASEAGIGLHWSKRIGNSIFWGERFQNDDESGKL